MFLSQQIEHSSQNTENEKLSDAHQNVRSVHIFHRLQHEHSLGSALVLRLRSDGELVVPREERNLDFEVQKLRLDLEFVEHIHFLSEDLHEVGVHHWVESVKPKVIQQIEQWSHKSSCDWV